MSTPLRFAVYTLARPPLFAACGVTAVALAIVVPTLHTPTRAQTVPEFPAPTVEPELSAQAAAIDEVAEPVHASDLSLVFSAGGATFMKLADVDTDAMPKHGKPKLSENDYVETAIANLADADVPAAYRMWRDREVTVDNTCTTKVTGFAIVSRLTGEIDYVSDDAKWTARNVLEHGSKVIAARLAGCNGTFARDAALPPVIIPENVDDAALAARAKQALLASEPALAAQRDYAEVMHDKSWWDDEDTTFSTKVVRHPTTGVTWVSVHSSIDHACGDPEVNVWGLYRVESDGTLTAVQLRKLDDLWSIDQLVDIDNDGDLELIGKPWLGLDTVVTDGSGVELDRLSLAFFGCPC